MKKPTVMRITRLERILEDMDKLAKHLAGNAEDGVKFVTDCIREEIAKGEKRGRPNSEEARKWLVEEMKKKSSEG